MTRYELLDRIGVGGMAEIFRGKAVAAGGFEKPVAIKRILPHLSQDKRFVELLIAEAKVLSLLKHRNIVQIFDVGLGDDGQYFLVMEYVDGRDLGAVQRAFDARRQRMPFDLALHVGAEICEALEHAHVARAPDGKPMMLVHRDVSPSNVLLSRAGEVKLTDFGIAKRAEEATGHGAVRGKFAYISPEQARNEHIDPRSDVFSVALLLWELIMGRRLFSGLGDLEALRAVRDAQVPRPLEVDPRYAPDARSGRELDALLMAALDRSPSQRPTAGELAARLRAIRYSLEVAISDPATELARLIDVAAEGQAPGAAAAPPIAQRAPAPAARGAPLAAVSAAARRGGFEVEPTEATVIRIRTADAFQARDQDGGLARAREVIDRFDEEETRLAQLSGEQLRMLRSQRGGRDLDDAPLAPAPPVAAPGRRRATDEPTTARPPIASPEQPTLSPARGGERAAPRPPEAAPPGWAAEPTRELRTPPPHRGRPVTAAPPPLTEQRTAPVVARAGPAPPRPAAPYAEPYTATTGLRADPALHLEPAPGSPGSPLQADRFPGAVAGRLGGPAVPEPPAGALQPGPAGPGHTEPYTAVTGSVAPRAYGGPPGPAGPHEVPSASGRPGYEGASASGHPGYAGTSASGRPGYEGASASAHPGYAGAHAGYEGASASGHPGYAGAHAGYEGASASGHPGYAGAPAGYEGASASAHPSYAGASVTAAGGPPPAMVGPGGPAQPPYPYLGPAGGAPSLLGGGAPPLFGGGAPPLFGGGAPPPSPGGALRGWSGTAAGMRRRGSTGMGRRRAALRPWMLVVGALVMAALAFAVTRAFLS